MYPNNTIITPSQQAVNGALDIFVEGHRKDDAKQMLVGLTVLRSSTEAQLHAAMEFLRVNQRATLVEMTAMLAP